MLRFLLSLTSISSLSFLLSFLSLLFHSLSLSSFDLSVLFLFPHAPPTTISAAKNKPIIAEPEIQASQSLEGVTGFLLLMSEGLIKALESAHGPEQANQVGAFTYPMNLLTNTFTTSFFDKDLGPRRTVLVFPNRHSSPPPLTLLFPTPTSSTSPPSPPSLFLPTDFS